MYLNNPGIEMRIKSEEFHKFTFSNCSFRLQTHRHAV